MEKLIQKLKDLKHKEFMVQMIDHWSAEDYKYDRELCEQIMETKKELKEKYGWEE